jgi:hypothetical protein
MPARFLRRMNPVGSYLADLYAVSGVVMPGSGEVRSGRCGEGFVDVPEAV